MPLIGAFVAAELSRADAQRMAAAIAAGKTAETFKTPKRGKAVVERGTITAAHDRASRRYLDLGRKAGFVTGANPVRGVEKHRADARDRVVSPAELAHSGLCCVTGRRFVPRQLPPCV